MAPHENAESFVDNYMKLLPESDITEFQKVLDMKVLLFCTVSNLKHVTRFVTVINIIYSQLLCIYYLALK